MTDKQIIIDGVDVSECEYYNKDDKTCREVNGKYETDICDFDKCENSNCYYKQLKRKEQECEKLKESLKVWKYSDVQHIFKINKYEQTLTEIKPILEFYANSKMGEEHPDKTYHIMLNGSCIMVYDPKPARQAIQKISEVENE